MFTTLSYLTSLQTHEAHFVHVTSPHQRREEADMKWSSHILRPHNPLVIVPNPGPTHAFTH